MSDTFSAAAEANVADVFEKKLQQRRRWDKLALNGVFVFCAVLYMCSFRAKAGASSVGEWVLLPLRCVFSFFSFAVIHSEVISCRRFCGHVLRASIFGDVAWSNNTYELASDDTSCGLAACAADENSSSQWWFAYYTPAVLPTMYNYAIRSYAIRSLQDSLGWFGPYIAWIQDHTSCAILVVFQCRDPLICYALLKSLLFIL